MICACQQIVICACLNKKGKSQFASLLSQHTNDYGDDDDWKNKKRDLPVGVWYFSAFHFFMNFVLERESDAIERGW